MKTTVTVLRTFTTISIAVIGITLATRCLAFPPNPNDREEGPGLIIPWATLIVLGAAGIKAGLAHDYGKKVKDKLPNWNHRTSVVLGIIVGVISMTLISHSFSFKLGLELLGWGASLSVLTYSIMILIFCWICRGEFIEGNATQPSN